MSEEIELEFEPETSAGEIDENYVFQTEEMIGLDFPSEFVDFLNVNNGGTSKTPHFKIGENVKTIPFFLCLVSDFRESEFGDSDIGVVWSQIEDRLNEYLIPFASVFAGDFLCLDYEDEQSETPKVVLWNHDLSDEDAPVTVPVAESFTEFLGMLFDNNAS